MLNNLQSNKYKLNREKEHQHSYQPNQTNLNQAKSNKITGNVMILSLPGWKTFGFMPDGQLSTFFGKFDRLRDLFKPNNSLKST